MKPKKELIKEAEKRFKKIRKKSELQVKYMQETIRSLTEQELLSIQMSNKLDICWNFAIGQELINRLIPTIATTIVTGIVWDFLEEENELKKTHTFIKLKKT